MDNILEAQETIVIFGAGELARLVFSYLSRESSRRVAGFVVDDEFHTGPGALFMGLPVWPLSEFSKTADPERIALIPATSGSELSRRRLEFSDWAKSRGFILASYISPFAYVDPEAEIGGGSIIMEANVIQSKARIGRSVVLWSGNHVGHLSSIGAGSFISSHAVIGGATQIGERCYLGLNATIRDGVSIGSQTVVGALTYVDKDFPPNLVLHGNPARVLKDVDPLRVIR